MPDTSIHNLGGAGGLVGDEDVPITKNGVTDKTTPQTIANLYAGKPTNVAWGKLDILSRGTGVDVDHGNVPALAFGSALNFTVPANRLIEARFHCGKVHYSVAPNVGGTFIVGIIGSGGSRIALLDRRPINIGAEDASNAFVQFVLAAGAYAWNIELRWSSSATTGGLRFDADGGAGTGVDPIGALTFGVFDMGPA